MPSRNAWSAAALIACAAAANAGPAAAQVDTVLARRYFAEAAELCERDGGRLWGESVCGPMVIADAPTGTIATSQPAPAAERPRTLGFANTVVEWGGQRWASLVWTFIPAEDDGRRRRLLLHELFHRIQAGLGLMTPNGQNDHLDTRDGRYWLRLEWRALADALRQTGAGRAEAVRDALSFREARHRQFPDASESERREEIREGLAQYTGTVLAAASAEAAAASAADQLAAAESQPTFVRSFAYPSGAAWGILLDGAVPGWRGLVRDTTDLAVLLAKSAGIKPSADAAVAAARYGGEALGLAEDEREREQQVRLRELRRRFVEDAVVVLPGARGAVYNTTGATPLPGHGTVFVSYRVTGEWGSVVAENGILVSSDGSALTLSAPTSVEGDRLAGDGWTVTLSPGWTARPGARDGDLQVVRAAGLNDMGDRSRPGPDVVVVRAYPRL